MPKYVTREETNFWGNKETVTRQQRTKEEIATDVVGGALGFIAGSMRASRDAKLNSLFDRAGRLFREGDNPTELLNLADQISRALPSEPFSDFFAGHAYAALNQHDQAIAALSRCLVTSGSDMAAAYQTRGDCYLEKKEYGKAIADYTAFIAVNLDNPRGYTARARVLKEIGNFDQAIEDMNKAISLEPGHEFLYWQRSRFYLVAGKANQALDDINRAIALAPNDVDNLRLRATIQELLGNQEAALSDMRLAETAKTNAAQVTDVIDLKRAIVGQWKLLRTEGGLMISMFANLAKTLNFQADGRGSTGLGMLAAGRWQLTDNCSLLHFDQGNQIQVYHFELEGDIMKLRPKQNKRVLMEYRRL